MIDSEVFGQIAKASALTLAQALFEVAKQLLETRNERWATEKRP